MSNACGSEAHPPPVGAEYVAAGDASSAASSQFDPRSVHVWGTIRQGACPGGAIAEVNRPAAYTVGFECNATRPFLSGRTLLYQDPDRGNGVFEFVADDFAQADPTQYTYPANPGANDIQLPTPCPVENGTATGPVSFVVGPTGRVLHACFETLRGNINHWYDQHGTEVFYNNYYDIIALGEGDLVLLSPNGTTQAWAALDLSKSAVPVLGWRVPAVGWSTLGSVYAVRSNPNGFHIVVLPQGATAMELWEIDLTDQAAKIGEYPVSDFDNISFGVLGPDDAFYSYANLNGANQGEVTAINRRTVSGRNTVAYNQAGNPVQLPARMFTGP
jgi:hypothetical protein